MAAKKKTKKAAPAKKAANKKSAMKKPAPKQAAAKKLAAPAPKANAEAKAKAKAKAKKPLPRLDSFLSPLDDRIVIQPDPIAETSAGGLYIPAAQEGPVRGTVLAKGPGHRNKKGMLRPLDVEVGDRVLFSEYAGTKLTFANAQILIVREADVLGVVL